MGKNGKQNYFRGDEWFQAKVNARVKASLEQQEKQFAEDHKHDTNEQLLQYLREFSVKLGRTPNPSEIIGGQFIFRRFGGWDCAVDAAGLRRPGPKPQPTHRMIFKEEYKRQAALFQQERKDGKEARKQAHQEVSRIALEAQRERETRDLAWGKVHSHYSQEQLSEYLCQCAGELGHSPVMKEVVGGVYIAKRFVTWPLALTIAGIPLPQGMKPPGRKDIEKYRKLVGCATLNSSSENALVREYAV